MVKVLKCHHFRSQQTLPVQTEPICLASGRKKIFVGTANSSIEVFSVGKDLSSKADQWQLHCSFQTGAPVTQIEYNDAGDYVATIERKESRRSDVVSVKVYLNWNIAYTQTNYRTRVRVAGLGYRSTKVTTPEQRLEVVDVTCEKPAEYLSTCQQTGNLVIAMNNRVKIYHLEEKTIPNSDTTFLDFVLFLELEFDVKMKRLGLCEEFLACSSKDFVQIFQIHISSDTKPSRSISIEQLRDNVSPRNRRSSSAVGSSLNLDRMLSSPKSSHPKPKQISSISEQPRFSIVGERGSSTPSPALSMSAKIATSGIEDDENFVHWTFKTPQTKDSPQISPLSNAHSHSLLLPSLENFGHKPVVNLPMPKYKDHIGGGHSTTGRTTLTQIVQKKLDESDHSWIQLQLLPSYIIGKQPVLSLNENTVPVYSGRRSSLQGMCCLLSGERVGYLYSLLHNPTLVSTYRYVSDVSDVIQVQTNGQLVYVATQNGLQTYTCRAAIKVLQDSIQTDSNYQVCPSANLEVCVCGGEKFLGAVDLTVTDKYVVVLSKIESSWGVYVLEDISPAEFYNDVINYGSRYHHNSPDTYLHLLLEGHMILRSQMIGSSSSQSDTSEIQKLLYESSALLGDFYAMPDCTDWHLCLSYYLMSKLSPMEVIRLQYKQKPLLANKTPTVRYGRGLIQYLKYVLFQDEDPLDLKPSDADLILTICLETMPTKVSSVILFSRVKSFTPEAALDILHQSTKQARAITDSKTKTLDMLAEVALNLQLCEPEIAMTKLSAIDKNDLIEACVNNHQILHVQYTELSPLSQMLRCHCPSVLIEALVLLQDCGIVSMDLAVQLLQGRSGVPELHKNTHVVEYLEILINDRCRRVCFEEAVPLLCEIYIQKMVEWEPPSIRQLAPSMKFKLPSGSGHFAPRHGWLDHMTPFTGPKSINSPCQYLKPAGSKIAGQKQWLQCQRSDKVCSCFLCNEELLKLQSILCYKDVSYTLCEKVVQMTEKHSNPYFYDSVHVLCMTKLNMDKTIASVTTHHSQIAADFGSSIFKHNSTQWEALLNSLLNSIEGIKQPEDVEHPDKMMALHEVLSTMATWLTPTTFIKVLPAEGNFFFFLPYIKLGLDHQHSSKLKKQYSTLGELLTKESENVS